MKFNGKKLGRMAGAVCLATGVVAVSALVASGAAAGAVTEGFKAAGRTMKRVLGQQPENTGAAAGIEEKQG